MKTENFERLIAIIDKKNNIIEKQKQEIKNLEWMLKKQFDNSMKEIKENKTKN